jgi:hypothetical protein
MTKVIHIRNKTGSSDEVYIGRGSKWGNPFKIEGGRTRETVIDMYRLHLRGKHTQILRDSLKELKGKTLVCHCKPLACHGDVLIESLRNQD